MFPNFFSLLPKEFILLPTLIVFVIYIYNFFNASAIEKTFESKYHKTLRVIIKEFCIYLFATLSCISFTANYYKFPSIVFFLSTILYAFSYYLVDYKKSKFTFKLYKKIRTINITVLRNTVFALSIISVGYQFIIFVSIIMFNMRTTYGISEHVISDILIKASYQDKSTIILYFITTLIIYIMYRPYIQPIFKYRHLKSISKHLYIITLTNNTELEPMYLIETFNDNYVFCLKENLDDYYNNSTIISKDKIQYIRICSNRISQNIKKLDAKGIQQII